MITGRRVQLADLAALARAATSGARIAWLVGAEGVGKSTLAGAAAAASGLPILQLDAYPEDLRRGKDAVPVVGAVHVAVDLEPRLEGPAACQRDVRCACWHCGHGRYERRACRKSEARPEPRKCFFACQH